MWQPLAISVETSTHQKVDTFIIDDRVRLSLDYRFGKYLTGMGVNREIGARASGRYPMLSVSEHRLEMIFTLHMYNRFIGWYHRVFNDRNVFDALLDDPRGHQRPRTRCKRHPRATRMGAGLLCQPSGLLKGLFTSAIWTGAFHSRGI